MDLEEIKKHSDDIHTQTAAYVEDGYGVTYFASNTLTKGVVKTPDKLLRPIKYKWIEHAERNLIYAAARDGFKLQGKTMVINWYPCADCARAIAQSGISGLQCIEPDWHDSKWSEDWAIARLILEAANVKVVYQ